MRSLIRLTLASAAVAAVACGKEKAPTAAMSEELKRDLQLATTQSPNIAVSADELAPRAQQVVALRPKKAPGPKVIRTETPTVKAAELPKEAAEIKSEIPAVQMIATSMGESDNMAPSAPPAARPAPIPMPTYPGPGSAAGNVSGGGSGGGSGGIGGILGGIFGGGVVIRGGGVGDDHCDPRTDGRRRGGRPTAGGGYVPGAVTPIGGMGGPRALPGRPRM